MTSNHDELQRAVERLEGTIARYPRESRVRTDKADLRLILSANREMREALEAQELASQYAADLARLSEDGTRLTESHMAHGRDLITKAKELRRAALTTQRGDGE